MVTYFDTSALVPLLIDEPSTAACTAAWNEDSVVISSAVAYVEVYAAIAQAARHQRLSAQGRLRALDEFEVIWEDVAQIPLDDTLIRAAAALSASHALRGYDAVHCATALAAASDDFFAVSGDRELLRAWSDLGIATLDTSG